MALALGIAGSATATTAPGFVYSVTVTMTDSRLVLKHPTHSGLIGDTYIQKQGLSARFPRGAQIRFLFINRGSATYLPALHVATVQDYPYGRPQSLVKARRVVAPGGHVELLVTFIYRGSYSLQELLHARPHGKAVPITIY
jgi:hypothetical protein